MAKTLDKKLLTLFKWLIILLPLFIFICLFLYPKILKISAASSDALYDGSISDEIINDLTNYYEDGDLYIVNNLSAEFETWFTSSEYLLWNYGIFSRLLNLLNSNDNNNFPYNNLTEFISSYLDYIIFIELLFMGLYLFRFFIHFGYELFERKKDL